MTGLHKSPDFKGQVLYTRQESLADLAGRTLDAFKKGLKTHFLRGDFPSAAEQF
jgi:hypothetical protein